MACKEEKSKPQKVSKYSLTSKTKNASTFFADWVKKGWLQLIVGVTSGILVKMISAWVWPLIKELFA